MSWTRLVHTKNLNCHNLFSCHSKPVLLTFLWTKKKYILWEIYIYIFLVTTTVWSSKFFSIYSFVFSGRKNIFTFAWNCFKKCFYVFFLNHRQKRYYKRKVNTCTVQSKPSMKTSVFVCGIENFATFKYWTAAQSCYNLNFSIHQNRPFAIINIST